MAKRTIGALVFPSPQVRVRVDHQWKAHMRTLCRARGVSGSLYKIIPEDEGPNTSEREHRNFVFTHVPTGYFNEIWIFGEHLSDALFHILRSIPAGTVVRNCATPHSSLDSYLAIFHGFKH